MDICADQNPYGYPVSEHYFLTLQHYNWWTSSNQAISETTKPQIQQLISAKRGKVTSAIHTTDKK